MIFTGQLGTPSSQPGRIVLGAVGAGAGGDLIELAADLVIELALDAGLIQAQRLAADVVVDLALSDSYTGPGSGLVVSGVSLDDQMELLEEGDTFRITLPWAGIRGRHGTARVLSRTVDNAGRLTFKLFISPTVDPSVMQSQADSGRPRLVVDTRSNLARRMANAEKTVGTLQANH